MARSGPLAEKYGNLEIPADHPGFRVIYRLAPGQDSVVVTLDGGAWPSGLVLTPEGSTDGVRFKAIPGASTMTAMGIQAAIGVQGLTDFALRNSTVGAAGWVNVSVTGHSDFGGA